jgi:lipopolysaccharide export system permease protein
MTPGPGGSWILAGVEERVFGPGETMELRREDRRTVHFDEDPDAFKVLPGRPAQMRRATLQDQIVLRRRLGLPAAEFDLEWHNKLAYPLAGVPAGLLALAVALRRERKGHLTAAITEAVAVSLLFWAAQGAAWSLGISGRLAPAAAAWLPDAIFLAGGLWALRKIT